MRTLIYSEVMKNCEHTHICEYNQDNQNIQNGEYILGTNCNHIHKCENNQEIQNCDNIQECQNPEKMNNIENYENENIQYTYMEEEPNQCTRCGKLFVEKA